MSTKDQVVNGFRKQSGRHTQGSIGRQGQTNIFYENQILYSFGYHFPLAIRYHAESEIPESSEGFGCGIQYIINGDDKYSVTTTQHQNQVIRECKPNVQIPFSALAEAWNWAATKACGLDLLNAKYESLRPNVFLKAQGEEGFLEYQRQSKVMTDFFRSEEMQEAQRKYNWCSERSVSGLANRLMRGEGEFRIVNYRNDTWQHTHDGGKTWASDYFNGFVEGAYKAVCDQCGWEGTEPEVAPTSQHRLGAVLFTIRNNYFLSSFDEQDRSNYFLCQVPGEPKTVEEAYENLKPFPIKGLDAISQSYLRQGDWFFYQDAGSGDKGFLKTLAKSEQKVVRLGGASGTHMVSRMRKGGGEMEQVYVAGIVQHSPIDGRSPEHKRLKLGDGKSWWVPVKNTSEAGWGAKGNVD